MLMTMLLIIAAPAAAPINPAAIELFERDPVLNGWALAGFDRNADGWLTSYEAQGAAAAFKDVADTDADGRVTVREYEAAKAFIVARRGSGGAKMVEVR